MDYGGDKAVPRTTEGGRDGPGVQTPPPACDVSPTASTNQIAVGDTAGESSTAKDKADTPAKSKMTSHQKITFASAALATLANTMAFSIISVFFPIEAKEKGMSQTTIGLVFTAFSFSSAIGSPIWGKIIPLFGARFIFLAGAFVTGGCNILFGFIIDMPSLATFTGFSFVIRFLEGIGSSASFTASSAIVAYAFPDNVGTAVSMIEMIAGLSYAIGPSIGGLIYDAGGFKLPFFILGGLVLLIDAVNFFLMPQQGNTSKETGPLLQLLRIPAVWVALLNVFVSAVALSSIDPTLSLHLKDLNFTVIEISLMFVGLGLMYAVFSVLWGAIADAKKTTRIMMIMGSYGTGLFFLLLGPSPLLKIPSTKLLAIFVLPFGGFVISLVAMPTFVDIFASAQWYGLSSGMGLTSVVSGVWIGGFSLGSVVGPLLGGALTQNFGYAYASTIFGGICIGVMIVVSLFCAWEYQCGKGRRSPARWLSSRPSPTDDEQRRLLPADA